jgi:hypothetical protein
MMGVAPEVGTRAETLDSEPVCLFVEAGGPVRFTLAKLPGGGFQVDQPICLQLLTQDGATVWLSNCYSSVIRSGSVLFCLGKVQTRAGSVFEFTDRFQPGLEKGCLMLSREVEVRRRADVDAGFLSRFSVRASTPQPLKQYEVFIPGIWYLDNRNVPAHALAGDLSEDYFICREDRIPIPLVMMRNKLQGATLTLIHCSPDGSTCLADYEADRVVNPQIQVASLGVLNQPNAAAALYYPASEGQRSYLRRGPDRGSRTQPEGWVERFHPVQPGVKHAYTLLIALSQEAGFPEAMRHAWRLGFEQLHPPVATVDVAACFEASIQLIARWSRITRGAPGVPFRLRLPQGELEDEEKINYQMGFVGQQIPLAYHLLRYGLLHTNEALVQKGEATLDFWATNSLTPEGLPRTWFDTWPEPHWRRYNTFLRVASDGMVGAVLAYDVMAAAGRPKAEWLAFCRKFGDWLVARQQPDGSWYREYNFDSTPASTGKQNSSHPIRYLVDLFKLTGDRQYLEAALRAGAWCWTNTHQAFCYVGGTVDNPNVMDKEAGFIALDAFLALHDATSEERWLKAAAQAADFTETWTYCWSVPIPAEDERVTYPRGATTTGFSLIACGHSGADLFLAGAAFLFYRLYLQTGDRHYADMARQFLYNTRQSMDINGSLGYGYPGLCTEALSLAPPRGRGVNTWLPWLSYSMMEPVAQLQETYGTMDIQLLPDEPRQELLVKDRQFGATRGLLTAKKGTPRN